MKTRNISFLALVVALAFIITGCSSGGGDSVTPTSTTQTFPLTQLNSTAIGTIYSTQLTGSDSTGVTYTGSLAMANRVQEMLNGVLVTPKDLLLSLTSSSQSITVTGTSYVDTNGFLIQVVIQTTGITCTPVSPDSMPATVKIGDFGILSTLVCSDNTTQNPSWRVEDAGNGNINLISSSVIKDLSNVIVSTTDVTYTINSSGGIIAFKTLSHLVSTNFTLTYQSK